MGAKELFAIALGLILSIGAGAYMWGKSDTKILQQKIVQVNQSVGTVREWASTFAGVSTTKDFTGINMASLKAKGLFNYTVYGSGSSSYITMPFDETIQLSLSPSSNNKEFIVTVTLSSANNTDATGKQTFEDKLNADFSNQATSITSYTSSSADGTISFQFGN